jgi:hypothetical protein
MLPSVRCCPTGSSHCLAKQAAEHCLKKLLQEISNFLRLIAAFCCYYNSHHQFVYLFVELAFEVSA